MCNKTAFLEGFIQFASLVSVNVNKSRNVLNMLILLTEVTLVLGKHSFFFKKAFDSTDSFGLHVSHNALSL